MNGMDRSGGSSRDQLRAIAHRAMAERGLLPDFSPAVQAETEAIRQAATDPNPAIRDLRDLLWCSIDNDDSRDLDQLTVTAPGRDGTVTVLVAVADVDALVGKGSAIDDHARANTTSVYTAAEIFPMLPEKLSTDLTSLGQDQARLAFRHRSSRRCLASRRARPRPMPVVAIRPRKSTPTPSGSPSDPRPRVASE